MIKVIIDFCLQGLLREAFYQTVSGLTIRVSELAFLFHKIYIVCRMINANVIVRT